MPPSSDSSARGRYALLAAAAAVAIHAIPATGHAQVVSGTARRAAPTANRAPGAIVPFAGPGDARARIIGMLEGDPVYADSAGHYFTVGRVTARPRPLDAETVARMGAFDKIEGLVDSRTDPASAQRSGRVLSHIRFSGDGVGGRVEILGVDGAGRTLHRNARGEVFHVDPVTGNLIFEKN